MPRAIPPDDVNDFEVHKDVLEYVKGLEAERAAEAEKPIPKDLFGLVSLLPRRLMGAALLFSLMALSAACSWLWAIRTARADDDGAALKYVMTQALPSLDKRVSLLETDVAGVRGTSERNERELKEQTKALARIEGKLDRALR